MLKNTFLHFKKISPRAEANLWRKGIHTWQDYLVRFPTQHFLTQEMQHDSAVQDSLEALEQQNMDYFANLLPRSEHYRIALTMPENVIFLDIETTGLSLHYDILTMVGWSVGKQFGVYINGLDDTLFRKALKQAKVIVTFNGTLFDIKFIKKHFDRLIIPSIHIDLRYFAKRVGLSGGQKIIEEQIGFKRNTSIKDMLGEAAPILWHHYRRGDNDAMKRLIEYNHADVEGMKAIFDVCVKGICKKNSIPDKIIPKIRFKKLASKINWSSSPVSQNEYSIFIPQFTGSTKPLITYSELNEFIPLDRFCVAGVDLVSSEERETGFCLLRGNTASTCRIKTDDEIIALILDAKANIVSIDSPLSIPQGRTTFWDTDPVRDQFGITRECERILKRRGISSYPCLIPSMQKLTQRGMSLAQKLRKIGIPVIESYPGAAQDIMAIPRKQAGLQYLVEGLSEFGIAGEFLTKTVSHDELDAITSAIVGLFFWVGKFEALGNQDEEYLIVPDLHADHEAWTKRKILGISGHIGVGKSTVAAYLQDRGFAFARFSDTLKKILAEEGKLITRFQLQEIGIKIQTTNKQRWLGKQVVACIKGKNAVIDGLRFPEDRATLIEQFGPAFAHVHLERAIELYQKKYKSTIEEDVPLNKALQHQVESSIAELAKLAHNTVVNNDTKQELFNNIDEIIGSM